jgi:hypothetical protein
MNLKSVLFCLVCAISFACHAQPGGSAQPQFSPGIEKLFGDNAAFTANLDMLVTRGNGTMDIPGKLSFNNGKSRFEMDSSKMKGGAMPAGAADQMKKMGMSEMVSISLPDKKESYVIYPGLKAYAVVPREGSTAGANDKKDQKTEIQKTEIGKETFDGHPCTKNKVVIKDEEGQEQKATVWNATDLNDFPVKIEMIQHGMPIILQFHDIDQKKPDDALFVPPTDFKRYDDVSTMMRESMMKRFTPPGGFPAPK